MRQRASVQNQSIPEESELDLQMLDTRKGDGVATGTVRTAPLKKPPFDDTMDD